MSFVITHDYIVRAYIDLDTLQKKSVVCGILFVALNLKRQEISLLLALKHVPIMFEKFLRFA